MQGRHGGPAAAVAWACVETNGPASAGSTGTKENPPAGARIAAAPDEARRAHSLPPEPNSAATAHNLARRSRRRTGSTCAPRTSRQEQASRKEESHVGKR